MSVLSLRCWKSLLLKGLDLAIDKFLATANLYLHKNTIEGTEKIEGQTNKHEQSLGLTKSRGRYATLCIPDSIYGLTLAWVTSENSTKQLECRHLDSSSSLDPILSATVSGVQCWLPLSVVPRQLSAARLSAVQRQLPLCSFSSQLSSLSRLSALSSPTASQLLSPANSHSRPLTTSGYGEISCPRILCLVSRQNRQRNRLLWRPTHIVLQHDLVCCNGKCRRRCCWFAAIVADCCVVVSWYLQRTVMGRSEVILRRLSEIALKDFRRLALKWTVWERGGELLIVSWHRLC